MRATSCQIVLWPPHPCWDTTPSPLLAHKIIEKINKAKIRTVAMALTLKVLYPFQRAQLLLLPASRFGRAQVASGPSSVTA